MKEEQPMDLAVELSKTLWAAQINLAAAMEKTKRELISALPAWLQRLRETNKRG